jgi:hypothetical protein
MLLMVCRRGGERSVVGEEDEGRRERDMESEGKRAVMRDERRRRR